MGVYREIGNYHVGFRVSQTWEYLLGGTHYKEYMRFMGIHIQVPLLRETTI